MVALARERTINLLPGRRWPSVSEVGSGMRAVTSDAVRRNRLSKTKSTSMSMPIPHEELSPVFHSRPFGAPSPRERGYASRINDNLFYHTFPYKSKPSRWDDLQFKKIFTFWLIPP